VRNRLGEVDATGRRTPVPIPGSEFWVELDTLIVAIGERPGSAPLASMGLEIDKSGRVKADRKTLETSLKGVFAGGDLVTGPNTVIDAVASGKKAALVIDRFLSGQALVEPAAPKLPSVYIEPAMFGESEEAVERAVPASLPASERVKNFREVEMTLTEEQALGESRRCLRCDLEFTMEKRVEKPVEKPAVSAMGGIRHD
jgi:NADH-quinone oxidoreductase subunit F